MPIKPSPTIAGKLRKLFSNNKQTIEPAIGDSIPGGSSGGNVLTLYLGVKGEDSWCYKDPECTEEYQSYVEAYDAVRNANIIEIVDATVINAYAVYTAVYKNAWRLNEQNSEVSVVCFANEGRPVSCFLWHAEGEIEIVAPK